MKKIFAYFGIFAAAAMTLASCAKEANDPNYKEEVIKEGIPFEIVANPQTKTTIDGLQTQWAADDGINLFHAAAGSTTYVDNGEFTIASEDLASGTFKGTLASAPASGTYDWYAVYPYTSFLHDVDNTDEARFYIGCRSDQAQTQTGNSSTAHLSGSNYPLFGKATGVAFDATPSVTLSPIASFIEVVVTNKNDSPLTVTNVTFTAPDGSEIVGNYIINFDTDPLTITKYKTYVSDEAVLNVAGASALAKNESASFYLGVKPFSTTSGDVIKVSVNGQEKTITTTKDFTFQAGKMKTVNFEYDGPADPAQPSGKNGYYRVDYVSWLAVGDHVVIAAAGYDKAMSTTQNSNNRGSVDITKGTDGDFGTLTMNDDVQEFVVEAGSTSGSFAFKAYNGDEADKYIYAASSSSNYLKSQATKDDNASFAISITDGKALMTAKGTNTRNLLKYNDASDLFSCYGSGQKDVAIYKKYVDLATLKTVTKLKDISDIPAAGVSAELVEDVYELTNATDTDITVTFDGAVVTDATAADGDVLFDVANNTGAARAGWIKISVAGGNTIQIDVNQLGLFNSYTSTFTDKYWSSTGDFEWTSGKDGAGFSNNGIQVTTAVSGANGTTDATFTGVKKVVVTYNTNKSAGAGKLNVKIGDNAAVENDWGYSSGDGRSSNYTSVFDFDTAQSGSIKLTATTTTNSIYIVSVAVTAAGCN